MKRLLFTFLVSLIVQNGFSQLTIEQIHSDSTALQFIKQLNYSKTDAPQWNFFYLTKGDEWKDYYNFSKEKQAQLTQNSNYLKWEKVDLNNDGKLDLIVSGYIARRPRDWNTATFKILVILSASGNGKTEYNLVTKLSEKYPAYFDMINFNGKNYLQLIRWHSIDEKIPLQVDTLFYNNRMGAILDYHAEGINTQEISKLQYRAYDDQDSSYHEAILENTGDRNINLTIFTKQGDQKLSNPYRAKVTKGLWMQLDTVARSLELPTDLKVYNARFESKELPTELTLFYANGDQKKIIDFGSEGSYSLMALYAMIETMMQNVFTQLQQRAQTLQQFSQQNSGFDF